MLARNPDNLTNFQSALTSMEIALNSVHEGIVWTDKEGKIQWCNETFTSLLNKQPSACLNQNLIDILPLSKNSKGIHPKDHPIKIVLACEDKLKANYEFINNGQAILLEIYATRLNVAEEIRTGILIIRKLSGVAINPTSEKNFSTTNWQSSNETHLIPPEYKFNNVLDYNRNRLKKEIKNRRQIEEKFRELTLALEQRNVIEEKLRHLTVAVEQSPNTIMITNKEGIVEYVNFRFTVLTGFTEQDIVGQKAQYFIDGHLSDAKYAELMEYMNIGEAWSGEFANKKKNGSYYWEEVIISPIKDAQEQISNYLLIIQDITARKRGEEQMKVALEMKSEFTSTVSHELRTPLASIKAAIDIVMSGSAGQTTADQERFLGKAKTNIDRLKRLIDDFLDLSKLEMGKVELDIENCDIKTIVKDVFEIQKPVADKKGLILSMDMSDSLPLVLCDPDRINQVFVNLVSNAIKFTEKGEINVAAKLSDDKEFMQYCVKDTGEGIRQEDLSLVFEKFKQFGDPAKRKTGGTGLGLTICQEIVVQHGGKIWVESELGKGSSFFFTIPVQERSKAYAK